MPKFGLICHVYDVRSSLNHPLHTKDRTKHYLVTTLFSNHGLNTAINTLKGTTLTWEHLGTQVAQEAQARQAMLDDLKALASQASQAGQSFKALSDQVEEKLSRTVSDFGSSMNSALTKNLDAYDKALNKAVNILKDAFEELAEKVGELGDK